MAQPISVSRQVQINEIRLHNNLTIITAILQRRTSILRSCIYKMFVYKRSRTGFHSFQPLNCWLNCQSVVALGDKVPPLANSGKRAQKSKCQRAGDKGWKCERRSIRWEIEPKRARPRKDAAVGTSFEACYARGCKRGKYGFHPRDIGWTHRRPDTKASADQSAVPRFA